MKEIKIRYDKYYYFTYSDNKVDFNSTDFIDDYEFYRLIRIAIKDYLK